MGLRMVVVNGSHRLDGDGVMLGLASRWPVHLADVLEWLTRRREPAPATMNRHPRLAS